MNSIRSVVNSPLLLFLSACSTAKYERPGADFQGRSPIIEAESDYEAGDCTIYSAMGIGHYYPGLDQHVGRHIANEHGEKMLSGTTDAMESPSHANYVGAATKFASDYNKHKAALIAQNAR